MDKKYNFGKAFQDFLDRYKLSQADVARRAKINPVSVNRYVNGKRTPGIDTIVKMADAFNVTIDNICGWKTNGTDKQRTSNKKDRRENC